MHNTNINNSYIDLIVISWNRRMKLLTSSLLNMPKLSQNYSDHNVSGIGILSSFLAWRMSAHLNKEL